MKLEKQLTDLNTKKEERKDKESVDMPTILTYIKYYMEHLFELLIDHCNPLTKAEYFGVMFDQVPSYAEIKDGTPDVSKITGLNELFRIAKTEKGSLVRERGLEPPRLAALVPQTSVSTIPPLALVEV